MSLSLLQSCACLIWSDESPTGHFKHCQDRLKHTHSACLRDHEGTHAQSSNKPEAIGLPQPLLSMKHGLTLAKLNFHPPL